jgi:hypothetical protein
VRFASLLLVLVALTACNRGNQSKDALRQAVIDHLSTISGMNVSAMTIEITEAKFNGDQAEATASITAKGVNAGAGAMTIPYHLEYKGDKWVVTGRKDSGGAAHGGIAPGGGAPTGESPHGAMPPAGAGGSGKMPSPEDLPPTKK